MHTPLLFATVPFWVVSLIIGVTVPIILIVMSRFGNKKKPPERKPISRSDNAPPPDFSNLD